MAGIGFAVGAGSAIATGNEDDWWKWGLAGGVLAGLSFDQDRKGSSKFNRNRSGTGYRESGGLRIVPDPTVANFFKSNWITLADAGLQQVIQKQSQWCVYACEESIERKKGGSRRQSDFASNQNNGQPLNAGTGTVGDWLERWKKDFPGDVGGDGSLDSKKPPKVGDVIRNIRKDRITSIVIHESHHPAGYDHNVLINKVQRNRKTGVYRYKLMDPNGARLELQKYIDSVHQRHIFVKI